MSPSPWEELGIEATGDAAIIRKAYALRLKQTRPEDDPAGFARLRAAYEAALAMAPHIAGRQAAPPEARAPEPPPDETQLRPEAQVALEGILAALGKGADEEAARRLLTAIELHLLPLRLEIGLKNQVAAALVANRIIPTGRLLRIAQELGWYDAADMLRAGADTPQGLLCARLDAELSAQKHSAAQAFRQPEENSIFRYLWMLAILAVIILSTYSGFYRTGPPHSTSSARPQDPPGTPPSECHGSFTGKPLDLLRRCAEAGASGAQNALGAAYYKGDGVPQDYARAFSLFDAAAKLGQTEARQNLAHMYRTGLGTAKDAAAARQLYVEGAKRGDVAAQTFLGDMMIAGEGGPVDAVQGFSWIRQAAIDGYIPAMASLGNLYEHGTGTAASLAKAAAWRKAAANAGSPEAIYAFGLMLRDGSGVAADPAEAYRWLSLAAQQDRFAAAAHAALIDPKLKRLPPKQRAVIEDEVASWKPMRPMLPAPNLQ